MSPFGVWPFSHLALPDLKAVSKHRCERVKIPGEFASWAFRVERQLRARETAQVKIPNWRTERTGLSLTLILCPKEREPRQRWVLQRRFGTAERALCVSPTLVDRLFRALPRTLL